MSARLTDFLPRVTLDAGSWCPHADSFRFAALKEFQVSKKRVPMKARNNTGSNSRASLFARFRSSRYGKLIVLLVFVALVLSFTTSPQPKPGGASPHQNSGQIRNRTEGLKPAAESEDVELFRKHVQWIHGLAQKSYEHVLAPWKLNQNVSVSTQEDAFGNAMLRVICLQSLGTPGVMQVGVTLASNTEYEVRAEGCTLPSADATKFQVCPFIDRIGADRSSQLVVWNCTRALREHAAAAEGELPCSDLDFHRGLSPYNRYEQRLTFKTGHEISGFRIGMLFSGGEPGDAFFLKQICWRPYDHTGHLASKSGPQAWECGYQKPS